MSVLSQKSTRLWKFVSSQHYDLLRAGDDLALAKVALDPLAQRVPEGPVKVLHHYLHYGDVVPLGLAAGSPEALSWGPYKAGYAAKLVCEFFQEPVEPFLSDGFSAAGFFGWI